nr:hypothetical protein [Martelella mediterranea]
MLRKHHAEIIVAHIGGETIADEAFYSLRGAGRFACSNHISKGTCSNSRTIRQDELESRVLSGIRDRMMAPEITAMRAYAEETNRLNRERRSNTDIWKVERKRQAEAVQAW